MEMLAHRDSGWDDPMTFVSSFFVLAIVDVRWGLSGVKEGRKEEKEEEGSLQLYSCWQLRWVYVMQQGFDITF